MDINLIIVILFIIFAASIFSLILGLLSSQKKKSEIRQILNTRVFLVTVPKEGQTPVTGENTPPQDYRQLISVAEQMFSTINSLYSKDIQKRIIKDQQKIVFEIVSQSGVISFYIACGKDLEQLMEKQINAYYPTAHIEKVRPHNIFAVHGENGDFATASLKLSKKFVLPIKTYLNLESDPLNAISNAMSKLDENSAAAYQLIIRPINENWRRVSAISSKKIQEGKGTVEKEKWYLKVITGFFDILSGLLHGTSKDDSQPLTMDSNKSFKQLTPMQDALMKAINEKASKTGYEVMARIVTVAENKEIAKMNLQNILSSFAQFGTPELNSFKVVTGDGRMVKDYILRRYVGKGMILNTEELASIYHFPNLNLDTPNVGWLMAKEMPPPANLPNEGTILGKSVYRGEEKMVKILEEDRRRHIFMIGKTGVGKTTLFLNAFEQDILEGKGCCFIDPLGDAIEDILGKIPPERQNDVILFDPSDTSYPMGLNLLEYQTPEQRDFLIQETIQIFYKLFDPGQTGIVGPQWEHWFRNAALTVMNQPDGGTLIDIPRIFTDDAFRTKLAAAVTDPVVKSFWDQQLTKTADFHKSEMYNYFISKFGRFMTNDLMRNIIGQKKSAFDLRKVMDEGKILLINLSKGKIGEVNSNLLGMVLVSKIQMAAFSRADTPEDKRRDFYLYVDEFQNFTTDSFATILSEARKYKLNLNITNQYIAQLTETIRDAVVGNAGTLISYRIGAADAEFLVKEYPGVNINDLTNLDRFNTYIKLLIAGTPSKPFSMKGIKSPTTADANTSEQIRNFSRQTYARPVAIVQQEFNQTYKKEQTPPAGINEPLNKL